MRTYSIFDLPRPMVLVRCRRCRRPAATYWACPNGTEGEWKRRDIRPCSCDPPPRLPEGKELTKLVERARRSDPSDGRAPVTVSV
jgi:hypothetical protein